MQPPQVRKIDDDTDNKETSKLTQAVHSEIDQTSQMHIFLKQSTADIRLLNSLKLFDHCFPKFCKNQYLPTHFHVYVPILANEIYPGLVSLSYIQIIQQLKRNHVLIFRLNSANLSHVHKTLRRLHSYKYQCFQLGKINR